MSRSRPLPPKRSVLKRRIAALGAALAMAVSGLLFVSLRLSPPLSSPQPVPALEASGSAGDGTRRMAARLEKLAATSDPARNPFLNRQRAEALQRRLAAAASALAPAAEFDLRLEMALEFLRAGEIETALRELERIGRVVETLPADKRAESAALLERIGGLAYMRLGEQENCVALHTSDSCLVPIGPGGVHEEPKGSRMAIERFTRALSAHPQDLETVWLLNLACMTLGEYPERVPRASLIPPRVFQSDYPLPRFTDVAPQCGLAIRGRAGGVVLEDFDNDGFLDVMKSSWGLRDPLQFFHNNGDGTFTERTKEAGLTGLAGGLNLVHADYNNDGYRDVLVLRGAWLATQGRLPNSLLRNNGDGTFSDVTEEAGLLSFHPTQTAVWLDYDGDGWLDLFIGNESSPQQRSPCELFHNNRDGTFTECAAAAGAAHVGFVKGVACGDYDNDGRPDLYLSCFQEPNILLHNAGPQTGRAAGAAASRAPAWLFQDVTRQAGVAEPIDSFPTWFFDYDNDGWLDLFVASYSWQDSMTKVAADYLGIRDNPGERPRLYHNNANGTFTDVTKPMRLDKVVVAMGANFGDLDNDGWLDFYLGTGDPVLSSLMPNRMFRNDAGTLFQDVTTSGGFGHVQKGHGIAFGDVDNDGDQDIFAVLGGAYEGDSFQSALFRNPGGSNHWVTLRLRGSKSNRDALGARIEVRSRQPDGNERRIHRVVSTGGSFGSSPLQQSIGLGSAQSISAVIIRWPLPGQPAQLVTNLPIDRVVEIREGEPGFSLPPLRPPPPLPAPSPARPRP